MKNSKVTISKMNILTNKQNYKLLRYIIIFVILYCSIIQNMYSSSADTMSVRYGIFGSYTLNYHNTDFTKLGEIPNCCPQFNGGDGKGYNFGLLLEVPMPYHIYLGIRAGYSVFDAKLTSTETQDSIVRVDDIITRGTINHVINGDINQLFVEPSALWNFWDNFSLQIGLRANLILEKRFNQYEELTSPSDAGVFVDSKQRRRNDTSFVLNDTLAAHTSLFIGLSYELPMNKNKTLFLVPEINYHQGIHTILRLSNWWVNSLNFGLSIKYAPDRTKLVETYKEIFHYDTLTIERDDIPSSYFIVGKTDVKNERIEQRREIIFQRTISRVDTLFKRTKSIAKIAVNNPQIKIQMHYVTEVFPLLPMVFFDRNSATISEYYSQLNSNSNFDEKALQINPVVFHQNMLNIIGYRLKNNTKANLSIKGYIDTTIEKGCKLAKDRASIIKDYFIKSWGIANNRIKIETTNAHCYPDDPTVTKNDSGYAENQRVELSSNIPEIFSPLRRKRYLEAFNITPDSIIIDPTGSTNKGLERWTLKLMKNDDFLLFEEGKKEFSKFVYQIPKQNVINFFDADSLEAEFTIKDLDGNKAIARKKIAIIKDTSDNELERLSLVLFKISSSEIHAEAQKSLKDFIKDSTKVEEILVSGYSDILGNQERNKELSDQRAINTANIIKQLINQDGIIKATGYGSAKFPSGINSYSTPAERFISRSVQIEIVKKRD